MTALRKVDRWGAAGVAVGIHLAGLVLLSIENQRQEARRPPPDRPTLYLDLEPAPYRLRKRPARSTELGGKTLPQTSRMSSQSPADAARAPAPRPQSSQQAPAMDLSRDWLTRRDAMIAHSAGARARAAGREGPANCAWTETLSSSEWQRCRDFASSDTDPPPPGPRSGDEDRTSGFAREAKAKRRWRDYRNGDGDYPGLRSMFGKN